MSAGRQPSPPFTKPRRPTTQLSRVNTRPTSLCTTRSKGMTGSPCGQHPRSGRLSWVHPAGTSLQPEAARRCTPPHPGVCTLWLTGLRYEGWCWQTGCGSISLQAEELCASAVGPPLSPPRRHTCNWGEGAPGHDWSVVEVQDQGWL